MSFVPEPRTTLDDASPIGMESARDDASYTCPSHTIVTRRRRWRADKRTVAFPARSAPMAPEPLFICKQHIRNCRILHKFCRLQVDQNQQFHIFPSPKCRTLAPGECDNLVEHTINLCTMITPESTNPSTRARGPLRTAIPGGADSCGDARQLLFPPATWSFPSPDPDPPPPLLPLLRKERFFPSHLLFSACGSETHKRCTTNPLQPFL